MADRKYGIGAVTTGAGLNETRAFGIADSMFRDGPRWSAAYEAALIALNETHSRGLGDLPSRLMGWAAKARARGRDRIEIDVETVDKIIAALTPHQGSKP